MCLFKLQTNLRHDELIIVLNYAKSRIKMHWRPFIKKISCVP